MSLLRGERMFVKKVIGFSAVFLLMGAFTVYGKEPAVKKGGSYLKTDGETKLEIVYKTVGKRELRLDLYYPTAKAEEKVPVIFYTHGGGWAAGSKFGVSKGLFSPVFTRLLDEGFAVASVQYRLTNKSGKTSMRDCVIDAKDAVRYVSENSDELGVDAERFYVMGDSAGGQMAMMLLLSSPESLPGDEKLAGADYNMVAGVSWYGPVDFENMQLFNHDDREGFKDRFAPRILSKDTKEEDKVGLYREMSPVNYFSKESPPLLMIQGDGDTTIPVKHAYRMQEKAKEVGGPLEVVIVKNAGHNWRKAGGEIDPTREEIEEKTVGFFLENKVKAE